MDSTTPDLDPQAAQQQEIICGGAAPAQLETINAATVAPDASLGVKPNDDPTKAKKSNKKASRAYPSTIKFENTEQVLRYEFADGKRVANALIPSARLKFFISKASNLGTRISRSAYEPIKAHLVNELNSMLCQIYDYLKQRNKKRFVYADALKLFTVDEKMNDVYGCDYIIRAKPFKELIALLKILNKFETKILITRQAIQHMQQRLNIIAINTFQVLGKAIHHAKRSTIFPVDVTLKSNIYDLYTKNAHVPSVETHASVESSISEKKLTANGVKPKRMRTQEAIKQRKPQRKRHDAGVLKVAKREGKSVKRLAK